MTRFNRSVCCALGFLICIQVLAARAVLGQTVDVNAWPLQPDPEPVIDVLHYRIELGFDESRKAIDGRVEITLVATHDVVDRFELNAETFRVRSVRHIAGGRLDFRHERGILSIALDRPMTSGDTARIVIEYGGEGIDVDPEAFGMNAGYDLGIDFKAESPTNPQLINTLSFPTGARHWFPSADRPDDKATSEVIATVRDSYRVVSNGRLVNVANNVEQHTVTYHWSQEKPHSTYLFVLAAGPYVVIEDSLGDLPINYWVYPDAVKDARRSFHRTPDIIAFFGEAFDFPYPWVKYDQVTIPGIGGGAESTSATVLGESTIHDAKADKDYPSHWLVAHEAAHQWWGDLVTTRTWGHAWLNEGFATYWEYRWALHDLGPDEGVTNIVGKQDTYLNEARTRYIRPIAWDRWRDPSDNFDRHIYQKAAAVIHMLHDVIGEAGLRASMSLFLRRHAYGSAVTDDLVAAVQDATGEDVAWFFDQWVYRPGHPVLEVAWEWVDSHVGVRVHVTQRQDTTTGVPVFRFPVDIAVMGSTRRTVHRVWVDEARETFVLPAGAAPLSVRFDPDRKVLKELLFEKSNDELVYDARVGGVADRQWAAQQLGDRTDSAGIVASLAGIAVTDGFWAVRAAALTSLRGVTDPLALTALRRGTTDADSRVRSAAVDGMDIGGVDVVPFLMSRFRREDSYLAQISIVRALGRIGDPSARPVVEEALAMDSPRDGLRRAARVAMEALR